MTCAVLVRQDRKIIILGGLLLLMGILAVGISVFIVMRRQVESLLSKNLESLLRSNARLFEATGATA